jgi:hypothetical protein
MRTRVKEVKPPEISEAAFTAQLLELCHTLGWYMVHFRAARTSRGWRTPIQGDGIGYPDTCLFSPSQKRIVWAELKRDSCKPTPEQLAWGEVIKATGHEWYLWKPKDFDSIVEILRR